MAERERDDEGSARRLGRREFLKGGIVLGAASLLVPRVEKLLLSQAAQRILVPSGHPTLTRWLRRREDFLHLHFEFYNLRLDPTGTKLVRVAASQDAFVVVNFPPQYLLEEAFPVEGAEFAPGPLPVGSRVSGGSRLAFQLAPFATEIPFTAGGLLDWDELVPEVVPSARLGADQARPDLRAPGPRETAIEAPWWLILSPSQISTWTHRAAPLTSPSSGRTELWHTILDTSTEVLPLPNQPAPREKIARGVWSRDPGFARFVCDRRAAPDPGAPLLSNYTAEVPFAPGVASLKPLDVAEIVLNSGDWTGLNKDGTGGFVPTPAHVDTLMLSALGAWIDADGRWEEEAGNLNFHSSLIGWTHRGVLGRDAYVETVQAGHFFPFGHRGVKLTITERAPHAIPGTSDPAAYLFQRTFYIPLETEKLYPPPNQPSSLPQPHDGRGLPFTRIRALTRVTPSVTPGEVPGHEVELDVMSVPTLDGKPYLFDWVGVDGARADIPFRTPVIFVAVTNARDKAAMMELGEDYNKLGAPHRPSVDLGGRRLALAHPNLPGDTTVVADSITFKADHPTDTANSGQVAADLNTRLLPAFWPAMEVVKASLPAVQTAAGGGRVDLRYEKDFYLAKNGFEEDNPGQVFALLDEAAPISFAGGGRGGAVANPDFKIDGLSRARGPVADAKNIRAGKFVPESFFAELDAKLLGGISLRQVIESGSELLAPKLLQREEGGMPGNPHLLITELTWTPKLKKHGPLSFDVGEEALDIEARYVTDLTNAAKSTSSIVGDLRNVKLVFPETNSILEISFSRIRFSSVQGSKPNVHVDLAGVGFPKNSPLRLVDKLSSFLGPALQAAAGQHGPAVDVTPSSIEATYTLPIPAVEVGVFLLQNVTAMAGLHIPFSAQPVRGTYAFSSRENPFIITVAAVGGGGFLKIRAGLDGIETVEGSLEFGGSTAVNLGVAKGSVHALGGIYYKAPSGGALVLEGYYRMGGRLRVLGLVTVSAEFYMGLKWVPADDKVVGKASLTVEIDMGLFSEDVSISVQRKFGGSGADPSFGQLQDETEWTTYCRAFASEVTT